MDCDSVASEHMTGSRDLFSSFIPSSGHQRIKIADGSLSPVAEKGTVILSNLLRLDSVLFVPKLSCNLLSVRKLTRDHNCIAKFFPSYCDFQDLSLGRTIGKAREYEGLLL